MALSLALAGLAGAGLGGLFGSDEPGVEFFDPKEHQEVRKWLLNLIKSGTPTIPTQQIAPMAPAEMTGQEILSGYLGTALPAEYGTAMGELTKTAKGGYADITKSPHFQPILSTISRESDKRINQLLRRLQIGGMAHSGPQRKQLATEVGAEGQAILAALGPYAEAERGRQFMSPLAILNLLQYGEALPERKMAAAADYGALPRQLEQARLGAEYEQQYGTTMFPYNVLSQLGLGMLGTQPSAAITGGEPSFFEQISPLLQTYLLTSAMA